MLALLLLSLPTAEAASPTVAEAAVPNVLFIAVDDLACTLGCYGDRIARTPHIDRLAASGTCFLNAYCQIPLCNPSRASVMTGLRPDTIAVYDLDRHFRDEVPDALTLPQLFRRAGHFVARVGKIYHYNVPASIGTDGFDDPPSWDLTINPSGRDKADEHLVVNAEPDRKISAALSWLEADGAAEEQTDGLIATEAIRLLRLQAETGQPFFIAAGFFRPHTPYVAPKPYFDLYRGEPMRLPYAPPGDRDDMPTAAFAHNNPVPNYGLDDAALRQARRAYYACTSMIDGQVGRLLDALEETGLADRTIVALWSDHGYHLGEHNGIWQKRTLLEPSARTPLIIRDPRIGATPASRRIVELLDLYPTLAELAGLEPPARLEGRSLTPLMRTPDADWDDFAFTQILRPADDRLTEPVMGRTVRTARFRYTEWNGGKAGAELYDLQADPGEFDNLASDGIPDALAEQAARLRKRLDQTVSPDPPSTPFNPARL